MTPQYKRGDRVRVTIDAEVIEEVALLKGGSILDLAYEGLDGETNNCALPIAGKAVTVEHIAPAEWPPRQGDLWRDRFGDLWFAHEMSFDGETTVDLRCAIDKTPQYWSGDVIAEYGPLTLVHREDQDEADRAELLRNRDRALDLIESFDTSGDENAVRALAVDLNNILRGEGR